jgi:hypothetical protein
MSTSSTRTDVRINRSGIEIKPLYGPEDVGVASLGTPGEPPYTPADRPRDAGGVPRAPEAAAGGRPDRRQPDHLQLDVSRRRRR